MKQMRNPTIELYRFLACIMIAVYHFEWLCVGQPVFFVHFYIWVEFFFIISGFFLAANVEKEESGEMGAIAYTFRQFKKLYIPYVLAFFFSFTVYAMTECDSLKSIVKTLWDSKWEFLLLQLSGWNDAGININGVTGQIAALLASTAVLYYLLKKHKALFANLSILVIIAIYAYIFNLYGNLSQWVGFNGWICVGLLRGFADMSVGAVFYIYVIDKIKNYKDGVRKIIQLVGFLIVSFLVWGRNLLSFSDLLLFIPVFAMLIACAYLEKQHGNSYTRVGNILGRIAYPIFLVHYGCCKILNVVYADKGYVQSVLVYFLLVSIAAIMLQSISKWIGNILRKQNNKLKY